MKVSELRIGNLIRFNNLIQPEEIITVTPRFFRSFALNNADETDVEINNYYQPIPLTEEWKKKLGLDENNCIGIYLDSGSADTLQVTNVNNEILLYAQPDDGSPYGRFSCCLGRVEYVHQLQNLYFVLTGEELKTK